MSGHAYALPRVNANLVTHFDAFSRRQKYYKYAKLLAVGNA